MLQVALSSGENLSKYYNIISPAHTTCNLRAGSGGGGRAWAWCGVSRANGQLYSFVQAVGLEAVQVIVRAFVHARAVVAGGILVLIMDNVYAGLGSMM